MTTSDGTLLKLDEITSLILQLQKQQTEMGMRLNEKIDELDNKIDGIDSRIDGIDNKIDWIDNKFDNKFVSLDSRFDALGHKVDTLDHRFEILDLKIEAVNAKIDSSKKDTIDVLTELMHKGYNQHEKRIKRLEEQAKIAA